MPGNIYSVAEKTAKKYHTRNPFELLDVLKVQTVLSNSYSRNGLKGYCTIMNRIPYVVINSKLAPDDQIVVAAHESGHIVIHSADLRIRAFKDNSIYSGVGRKEREANLFAADFRITDEEVLDLLDDDADCFNIAKTLCVPYEFFLFKLHSMAERGYALRLPVDLDNYFLRSRN